MGNRRTISDVFREYTMIDLDLTPAPQTQAWGSALLPPLTGRHLRNLARIAKGKLPRFPAPAAFAH